MSPPPRRTFSLFQRTFHISEQTVFDFIFNVCTTLFEKVVLIIGPVLICFALAIIYGLSHTFFTIVLPMLQLQYQDYAYGNLFLGAHILFVLFLLTNVIFNYLSCVVTRNYGPEFKKVVRELALATDFSYPETPTEVEHFRQDFEDKMLLRMRRRQARAREIREGAQTKRQTNTSTTNNTDTTHLSADNNTAALNNNGTTTVISSSSSSNTEGVTQRKAATKKLSTKPEKIPSPLQVRDWMLMAPEEWGYCQRSKQPKPPRSHFDHVTKTLVLCLDHYCPWMFNAVGYLNYRYFCNFLWFVELGMMYGAFVTYLPWKNCGGPLYKNQVSQFRKTGVWKHIYPHVPIPRERMPISLTFMLCLAIGIAVACLGGFHLYLVLTGQTTIEFHGNFVNKRKARKSGHKFKTPYDLGWRRNWQQVYGTSHPLIALLPSRRPPEFLPLPIPGDEGKRAKYESKAIAAITASLEEKNGDMIV